MARLCVVCLMSAHSNQPTNRPTKYLAHAEAIIIDGRYLSIGVDLEEGRQALLALEQIHCYQFAFNTYACGNQAIIRPRSTPTTTHMRTDTPTCSQAKEMNQSRWW
jgi:hypothetical protein